MAGLSISEVSAASGLAASALRYYESLGLIHPTRDAAGRRRYRRTVLRRLGLIRLGRGLGLSLEQITTEFTALATHRAPTQAEWRAIAGRWDALVQRRLARLADARRTLQDCAACGCLLPGTCALLDA